MLFPHILGCIDPVSKHGYGEVRLTLYARIAPDKTMSIELKLLIKNGTLWVGRTTTSSRSSMSSLVTFSGVTSKMSSNDVK